MISSLVWLYLISIDKIQDHHWLIYLPAVIMEMLLYLFTLLKACDFIDRVTGKKTEGEDE